MSIIRPRLNDYHKLPFTQEDVDFAIPFVDEDIPLYVDPFLLWKSPSQQDNSLHLMITDAINALGNSFLKGSATAIATLVEASECQEIGLGNGLNKSGRRIGNAKAEEVLSLYKSIPDLNRAGMVHIEEMQLLIDNIAQDRISDFSANFIKSFLVDYTIDQCDRHRIPMNDTSLRIFNKNKQTFTEEKVRLPINPVRNEPILLVPKRWLRYNNFIGYDDFFRHFAECEVQKREQLKERVKILQFNRHNYNQVKQYVQVKERSQADCHTDPLFRQIPVSSANKKVTSVLKLPTGKIGNADRIYEDTMAQLLASMLYPDLDFAREQSRTITGVSIRDIIFYNNRSLPYLAEIYDEFAASQLIVELKNVKEITPDHIDQLNRYLGGSLGKFGIIFTRNPPAQKIIKNTIDLWSGQRKCILILSDADLSMMGNVFDSKQRKPIEVLNSKLVEFKRLLPA
jgi:hypothetical protein